MKTGFKLFSILSLLVFPFSVSAAHAEIALNPKGTQAVVSLAAGANQPVTAYVLSKGNETQYITVQVQAPNGTKVSAKAMVLGKSKPAALLAKASGWLTATFVSPTGKEYSSITVGGATLAGKKTARSTSSVVPVKLAASSDELYCGSYSAAALDYVIDILRDYQGKTYTRNQLCVMYGFTPGVVDSDAGYTPTGGDTTPTSGNGGSTVISGSTTLETMQLLVRKDTCSVNSKGTYIVRIDLSFAGVSAETFSQPTDILLSAKPIAFTGSKASSLKPSSDGKFAPRALFLMATTGGYSWYGSGSSEKVNVAKWTKKGPSIKILKIEDMVYWRGHSLARIVAEPVLRGGKGVVEMQSSAGVYSVCFTLSKFRQKFNGYS